MRTKYTFHLNSFLFACFSNALKCCKCARMRFHCATVLVVLGRAGKNVNFPESLSTFPVGRKLKTIAPL